MSKLEELIQQYCPDGVEYKTLGEATLMKRGTSATKGVMQEGDVPVISGGRQPAFYCDQSNRTGETITVAGSGAGAGYVQYWNEPIFVCDAFSVQGNEVLNTKFIYYYMTSIQEKIYATKKGGGVPHVHISSIDKFEIPAPPLPVQEEIVRILDTFTELQAELQAELQKRLQQYNYYRDNLLSFEGRADVEWKRLGNICSVITKGTTPPSFEQSGVSFVKTECFDGITINKDKLSFVSESIHQTFLKRSILNENDILITIAGATIGKCVLVPKEILPANTNQALAIIRVGNENNYKYVFHIIRSGLMSQYIKKSIKGSAQPNLTLALLNDFIIPLPSFAEQQRIVDILDRFDSLTNDLTQGLPAEIEKRKQQYEYYRDKLLIFKRLNA